MTTTPNGGAIPEGTAVTYTDEHHDEWAAVVVQKLPGGRYDVRLTDTPGRQKVVARRSELEPW